MALAAFTQVDVAVVVDQRARAGKSTSAIQRTMGPAARKEYPRITGLGGEMNGTLELCDGVRVTLRAQGGGNAAFHLGLWHGFSDPFKAVAVGLGIETDFTVVSLQDFASGIRRNEQERQAEKG